MPVDAGNDTAGKEQGKTQGGVYAVRVPPSTSILPQARTMVADPTLRVDDLADLVHRDPVIVVELLRVANSVQFSAGRPPATNIKASIERLGGATAATTLDDLKNIPQLSSPQVAASLESARARCVRTGLVANVLADILAKSLVDECVISSLLNFYGEMLAAVHLGADYGKLATELPRVKLLFRLEKDFKFDSQKIGINYLRRFGVPEAIVFGFDPEAQSKTPGRGVMKTITQAAADMAVAFEVDKWEKLAPGNVIPPKSPIRMLGLSESQYQSAYERISEVLSAEKGGASNKTAPK